MNWNIAGTPNIVVTLCAAMSASARPGSKARCRTTSPPFCNVTSVVTLRPPIWKIGAARQRHIVRQAIERMHAIGVVPPEIAMGQHRALGPAGGAGGVHDHRDIILADPDGIGRGRGRLRPVRLVLGGEESLERLEPIALRLDDRAELRVDDERARRAILDHEGELRPGQAEIERHEDRAEPRRGKHDEEEHRLVEAEESDALALADAERRQPRRAVLDRLLHVGVSPGRAPRNAGPCAPACAGRAGGTSWPVQCPGSCVSSLAVAPSSALDSAYAFAGDGRRRRRDALLSGRRRLRRLGALERRPLAQSTVIGSQRLRAPGRRGR